MQAIKPGCQKCANTSWNHSDWQWGRRVAFRSFPSGTGSYVHRGYVLIIVKNVNDGGGTQTIRKVEIRNSAYC